MDDRPNDNLPVDTKIYTAYQKTRSWVAATLGIIITVVAIAVMFFIASLEGTHEVKAGNRVSGEILGLWREENGYDETIFPQPKVDQIEYENRIYYFVEIYNDEGQVVDWYYAYDGGITYIFGDYKFYVLTGLTIVIALFVSNINYLSSVRSVMNGSAFASSLEYYKSKKDRAAPNFQYLPKYTAYKNKQTYDDEVQDIVESANLNYSDYIEKKIDMSDLEKWQTRRLKRIRKIRIERLKPNDLLYENRGKNGFFNRTVKILPMSQSTHQRRFLTSGAIQKIVSSLLGGLVVGFGVEMGNWGLGATYGIIILLSMVSAVVIGTDFAHTVLRNRFIAKGDLLNEFCNLVPTFEKEEKEVVVQEETKGLPQTATATTMDDRLDPRWVVNTMMPDGT